jgi:uncharacterized protein (DUF4415 family)
MKPSTRFTNKTAGKIPKKTGPAKKKTFTMQAVADESEGRFPSSAELGRWYKPLKTPVTLRLDAEVLAWFKREGRGYQTRINKALRKVMQRERDNAGK